MLGVIAGKNKSYEVVSMFDTTSEFEEGKLYVDPSDGRVYMYSKSLTRSNPDTGFFPIYNGTDKYISKFSNIKYLKTDVTVTDINVMNANIDKDVASSVIYKHRRCNNDDLLKPELSDGDNMFTQCIKGILNKSEYSLIDLVDMSKPAMDEKKISNYYSALVRITFMRLEKWNVWIDQILHLDYTLRVFNSEKELLLYKHPSREFEVADESYNQTIGPLDDPFKTIIRIIMGIEGISKASLRSPEIDDHTINNMMTTLNGSKSLSSQLFSRFIRMANLSYEVNIYRDDEMLFEYKES